eukprot:scaffold23476_cov53-Attheya_sp.AAC.9
MGGVWFSAVTDLPVDQVGTRLSTTHAPCDQGRLSQLQQPIVCRAQFPKHISIMMYSLSATPKAV